MKKPKSLRAIGLTCGIGSMLVGARNAGFEVLSNVEWRKYYHWRDPQGKNTFTENFRGAIFKEKVTDLTPQEVERIMNADLAMGHPECGNFSQLGASVKGKAERLMDPGDIPLFVEMVAKFKPRFFVMDDLPKSFGAYPMSKYAEALPEYDLFPEWVSNWGYGNVQKHRNRMFMIGSLKKERWAFRPGETVASGRSLENCIGDLPTPRKGSNFPNHDPYDEHALAGRNLSMRYKGDRPTWREVADFAKANWKTGESMTYHAEDGTVKRKPGYKVEHWDDRGASVQCGQAYKLHPIRFTPLTYRERARIQGFPDDFIFYGTVVNERGEYHLDKNLWMTKQTGKAMPVQFCQYVAEQVAAHIEKREWTCSDDRVIPANEFIDAAKEWYCEEVGYADQKRACSACWLFKHCKIRHEKYGLGPEPKAHAVSVKKQPGEGFTSPRPRAKVSKQRQYADVDTEDFKI